MSVHRNRTPRTAALFLSLALAGGAALTTVPALAADAPVTSVARLSLAKAHAGDIVLVKGAKLATKDDKGTPSTSDDVWVAKAVKFGDKTVTASDVSALSATTLVVKVPTTASGSVSVVVGDAVKGPKFTYVANVDTDQDDLDDVSVTSEAGKTGATIAGDHFTKSTKVLIGGKAAKLPKTGGGANEAGTTFTFDYPAGLTGEQDVVVTDNGYTDYIGYVTYSATKPTITSLSVEEVLVEAPTAVTLTGDNLDLVTGVTFNGTEKVTFAKTTDKTKLTVTVPKGTAVEDKDLVVTTKFGETATETLSRVAAKAPTVSKVEGQKAAGGEVTLTGTNLVGLKTVKVYSTTATVKVYSGSKISVTSATSAKVTLPVLPDNAAYKIEVTTWFASPSAKFDFNVGTPAVAPTVSGATGADGGTEITIAGSNLSNATKVELTTDGAAAVNVTADVDSNTASEIVVTVPTLDKAKAYTVKVTTAAGATAFVTVTVS